MCKKTIRLEKTLENGERYSLEEILEMDEVEDGTERSRDEDFGAIHESAFSDIMEAYRDYKMCNEW